MTHHHVFPRYSGPELAADGIVHGVGLTAAVIGLTWLLARVAPTASVTQAVVLGIYGLGLVGMLSASALYNFTPPGRLKAIFRKLDHAMIFVMIAGSYTPFSLLSLPRPLGVYICLLVWTLAAIGVALKVFEPVKGDRITLAMYLGLGWLIVGFWHPLVTSLSHGAFLCLLLGGVVYSLGTVFHMASHLRFHNAAWHASVVLAAALHFAAIEQVVARA